MKTWAKKLNRESGQSLVEYTLVISVVVIVCVAAMSLAGTRTSTRLASVASQLQ